MTQQQSSRRRTASTRPSATPAPRRLTVGKVLGVAVLLVAVVFLAQLCSTASPINVTVNGSPYTLRGEKTLQVAIKESGLPVNPGDLISLNGVILERSAGYPFYATVNGEEIDDADYKLRNGDIITLTDGKDRLEPYDAVESAIPYGVSTLGTGPIRTFTLGEDGVMETRTGQISGEVVEKQTVAPTDLSVTCSSPDVSDRKVIALTFDDGPDERYTADILDILAQNNAKATFFFLGEMVDYTGPELVKRAADEGHQVCTHSYDNALVAGGEMSQLSPEQQLDQLTHGLQTITDAIGYEPTKYVRLGEKLLEQGSIMILAPHIDAEIGWTLDTGDWIAMDQKQIFDVLMSAQSGDVIRMHDGGGNQETTVAALKSALPKLAKRGFSFVTIDELIGTVDEAEEDTGGDAEGEGAAEGESESQS